MLTKRVQAQVDFKPKANSSGKATPALSAKSEKSRESKKALLRLKRNEKAKVEEAVEVKMAEDEPEKNEELQESASDVVMENEIVELDDSNDA